MELLAAGRYPKEIAGDLGISVHTVRNYIVMARYRTGARTTLGLLAMLLMTKAA